MKIRFSKTLSASHLGGYKPYELKMPNIGAVAFQYLGFLSQQEPIFKSNGFDLDLIFPVYSDVEKVFIDYSDPAMPTVINAQEVEQATTSHAQYITPHTIINYLQYEIIELPTAPLPRWIQKPFLPICPKSGQNMDFLLQLDPNIVSQIPVKYSNIKLLGGIPIETIGTNGHIDTHYVERPSEACYKNMNFHTDGSLFVFYQPQTKIVCYFIQQKRKTFTA